MNILTEICAARCYLPVDARLNFAGEEGVVFCFLRTTSFPRHTIAHKLHSTPCFIAFSIETHLPEKQQNVHRRIPTAVPCRTAPSPISCLLSEQSRACAHSGDPCTLSGNLIRRRIGQVLHHLPADRRIGIKQPLDH